MSDEGGDEGCRQLASKSSTIAFRSVIASLSVIASEPGGGGGAVVASGAGSETGGGGGTGSRPGSRPDGGSDGEAVINMEPISLCIVIFSKKVSNSVASGLYIFLPLNIFSRRTCKLNLGFIVAIVA